MLGTLEPGSSPAGRSDFSIRSDVLRSASTCVLKVVTARNLGR